MNYEEMTIVLKALGDPNRLKIIDLLSGGSLCACDLLQHFDFTQPTLSHHMKVLEKAGVVVVKKEGIWHHYKLTERFVTAFMQSMLQLFSIKEETVAIYPNENCVKES
ncbi:transcriptional regulator [Enterococcus saigonensis]|uniref:Transcriptional regulator n=1 Tax=Enterococcus saigonensis TaxID=1805431 RepID=A0A679IFI3_9ENTE|nr:metalloregulator ArsR/SmtB family transcription factor [Enterococcus saigonensis]BCA84512.1 transcriptional regulator [Enterococcus saigonensis]